LLLDTVQFGVGVRKLNYEEDLFSVPNASRLITRRRLSREENLSQIDGRKLHRTF